MSFAISSNSKTTLISIPAEFDAHEVEKVRDQLDELVEDSRCFLVLDFTTTRFIDSSGIGAIVYLYKRIMNRQCQMQLLRVSGQPRKLMTMLRVDKTIPFIEQLPMPVGA